MSTMTITIERTPRTLQFGDTTLQAEELSVRLPFARKPADLSELGGSDPHKIYVTETRVLTTAEFDAFAGRLLASRDWLRGKLPGQPEATDVSNDDQGRPVAFEQGGWRARLSRYDTLGPQMLVLERQEPGRRIMVRLVVNQP